MGETGVVKTAWLNFLANYLIYGSLDDAIKAPGLMEKIPTSFVVEDLEGYDEQQKITVGVNEFNDIEATSSKTQEATVIIIRRGRTTLRFIDTPGIGDTRGTLQHEENMDNILQAINNYDNLHGILILLKPDSSRLSQWFRFAIDELLKHLHRDACKNILFGFTNTCHGPGTSMKTLKKLLEKMEIKKIETSKDSVFCFDSEGFLYLAANKNGVDYGGFDSCKKSWDKSSQEVERMLKRIESLQSHQTTATVSLNRARNLITTLITPMSEISRVIEENIQQIQVQTAQIKNSKVRGKKQLMRPAVELVLREVQTKEVVCKNDECIVDDINKQVCHEKCRAKDAANLFRCRAFKKRVCQVCGHHCSEHLLESHTFDHVSQQVEVVSIREQLNSSMSDREKQQLAIAYRKQLVKEHRDEQTQIDMASAKFGFYLEQNSITLFNEAQVQYIQDQLKQEKMKLTRPNTRQTSEASLSNTKKSIASLEKRLVAYQEYYSKLKEAAEKRTNCAIKEPLTKPEDVDREADKLFKLKHFGEKLREVMSELDTYQRNDRHEVNLGDARNE